MSEKQIGLLLAVADVYSLTVGILNKKNLFGTTYGHSDKYYPRRIATILVGIFLILVGLKLYLQPA